MKAYRKTTLVACITVACAGMYVGAADIVVPKQVTIPGVEIMQGKEQQASSDPVVKEIFNKVVDAQLKELPKEKGGDLAAIMLGSALETSAPMLQSSTVVILKEDDANLRFHYPYASIRVLKEKVGKSTTYTALTTGGLLMTEIRDMDVPKDQKWDGKTIYYDEKLPYDTATEGEMKASLVARMNAFGKETYTESQVKVGKFSWPNMVGTYWDMAPYPKEDVYTMPTINFAFAKGPKTTYHMGGYFWDLSELSSAVDEQLMNPKSKISPDMVARIFDKTGAYALKRLGEDILPTIQEASQVEQIAREEKLGGLEYYVPLSFKLKNNSTKEKRIYVDQNKSLIVEMQKANQELNTEFLKDKSDKSKVALRKMFVAQQFLSEMQGEKTKPYYSATIWNEEWPSVYIETLVDDTMGDSVRQMKTVTFDDSHRYTLTMTVPTNEKTHLHEYRDILQTVETDTHVEETRGESVLGTLISVMPVHKIMSIKK